jgi:hypothetical protein
MPHSSLFCAVFILFSPFILRGQNKPASFSNLVINPGFEERKKLSSPHTVSIIDSIEEFVGWSSPTIGRAEVYSTDQLGWIEDNTGIRRQRDFKARNGQNVAKIDPYGFVISARKKKEYEKRSYLQGELTEPLEVGQKYYIGFWSHFHCLATNNIGMAFSTKSVLSDTVARLLLTPKVLLKEVNNYNADKIWQLSVDSFIADNAYRYCIIGNFFRNDSTGLGGSKGFDHYLGFVDDVFVMKARNSVMQPRPEPPPKKPATLPKVLNKVQFLYNSAEFEPNSLPQLDSAVVVLKNYPTLEILIKGHTSSEGEADYNQKLSEKRAEAVKNYLIQHGIDAKRLSSKGFGESQLLVTDDSEENKRLNRRIEFEIVKE